MTAPEPRWDCGRCGWRCPHGEGVFYCPNCGPAKPIPGDPHHVTYEGGLGCSYCGLPPGPNLNDPEVQRRMDAVWEQRIAESKRKRIAALEAEIAALREEP